MESWPECGRWPTRWHSCWLPVRHHSTRWTNFDGSFSATTPAGDWWGVSPKNWLVSDVIIAAPGETFTLGDVAASLCPPPESWNGCRACADVTVLHRSGRLIQQTGEYLPLGTESLTCVGVVAALYGPMTDPPACELAESEARTLHQRLMRVRRVLAKEFPSDELIGDSPAMQRVRDQVRLALRGQTNTLVHGPPGSGREPVARAIHYRNAPETAGPLVPLFCALLDAELLQTTIKTMVQQLSDVPDGRAPCLLLLEVDQLPPDAQSELAGFMSLPGFEFYTVATSQQPLSELVAQDRFRSDLACQLSTLVIELPSLAVRPQDVPLLCQFHLEKFNALGGKQFSGLAPEALDELCGYPWPENVDELAEVVEEACERADGPYIQASDLNARIRWSADAAAHPRRTDEPVILDDFLAQVEKELLSRAMAHAKGNKTRAAGLLSMTRARFLRRLEQLGVES